MRGPIIAILWLDRSFWAHYFPTNLTSLRRGLKPKHHLMRRNCPSKNSWKAPFFPRDVTMDGRTDGMERETRVQCHRRLSKWRWREREKERMEITGERSHSIPFAPSLVGIKRLRWKMRHRTSSAREENRKISVPRAWMDVGRSWAVCLVIGFFLPIYVAENPSVSNGA